MGGYKFQEHSWYYTCKTDFSLIYQGFIDPNTYVCLFHNGALWIIVYKTV